MPFLFFENILKEMISKYISGMSCMKDLPIDVLSKIVSYTIGAHRFENQIWQYWGIKENTEQI